MLLRRFFHKTSNSKSIIAICIICIGISLSILDNIIHSAYIGTISGLLSGISFSIYEIVGVSFSDHDILNIYIFFFSIWKKSFLLD